MRLSFATRSAFSCAALVLGLVSTALGADPPAPAAATPAPKPVPANAPGGSAAAAGQTGEGEPFASDAAITTSLTANPADRAQNPADADVTAPLPEAPPPPPRHKGIVLESGIGAMGFFGKLRNVSPIASMARLNLGYEPFGWFMVFIDGEVAFTSTRYANPPPSPRGYSIWGVGAGVRATAHLTPRVAIYGQGDLGGMKAETDALTTYGFRDANSFGPYFGALLGVEWYQNRSPLRPGRERRRPAHHGPRPRRPGGHLDDQRYVAVMARGGRAPIHVLARRLHATRSLPETRPPLLLRTGLRGRRRRLRCGSRAEHGGEIAVAVARVRPNRDGRGMRNRHVDRSTGGQRDNQEQRPRKFQHGGRSKERLSTEVKRSFHGRCAPATTVPGA